jgi:hypothetical protein
MGERESGDGELESGDDNMAILIYKYFINKKVVI